MIHHLCFTSRKTYKYTCVRALQLKILVTSNCHPFNFTNDHVTDILIIMHLSVSSLCVNDENVFTRTNISKNLVISTVGSNQWTPSITGNKNCLSVYIVGYHHTICIPGIAEVTVCWPLPASTGCPESLFSPRQVRPFLQTSWRRHWGCWHGPHTCSTRNVDRRLCWRWCLRTQAEQCHSEPAELGHWCIGRTL